MVVLHFHQSTNLNKHWSHTNRISEGLLCMFYNSSFVVVLGTQITMLHYFLHFRDSNYYAAYFLHFWVFTLGVPSVVVLTLLQHAMKGSKKDILGVLVSY